MCSRHLHKYIGMVCPISILYCVPKELHSQDLILPEDTISRCSEKTEFAQQPQVVVTWKYREYTGQRLKTRAPHPAHRFLQVEMSEKMLSYYLRVTSWNFWISFFQNSRAFSYFNRFTFVTMRSPWILNVNLFRPNSLLCQFFCVWGLSPFDRSFLTNLTR